MKAEVDEIPEGYEALHPEVQYEVERWETKIYGITWSGTPGGETWEDLPVVTEWFVPCPQKAHKNFWRDNRDGQWHCSDCIPRREKLVLKRNMRELLARQPYLDKRE